MLELDLVVFDIAGTTIRASDHVPDAFSEAFANVGIQLPDQDIQAVRGKSKREAIAGLLHQDLDATEVYLDFKNILMQQYDAQGVEPIDGAEETFEWLKSRNIKTALTTGFDRDLAHRQIRKVGWEEIFDAVVCDDDVDRGRPAPDLIFRAMEWTGCENHNRVAAVGDTVSDLEAAGNAGVAWCIGVLSGAHDEEQLNSCAHTAIISSIARLPEVLVGGQVLSEFRLDVDTVRPFKNDRY